MKENFVVSIITPFYKGNKYLNQLFSVININYANLKLKYPQSDIELLIINDSPDTPVNTWELKNSFNYRIINHEQNSGIHQARVTGLKHCIGDYIIFFDQDDVLEDNALVSQIDSLIHNNADMVVCNAMMEEDDGSHYICYKSKTDFNRINDLQFYLKSHNVIKSPGQCLIKKGIIPAEWKKYIMTKNGSDDLFLWILLLEKSYRFYINREVLYIHKYTGENLSETEEKMNLSSLEIVEYLNNISYVPSRDTIQLK